MTKRICMFLTCAFLLASAVTAAAQGTNAGQKIDRAIRLMDDGLYEESEALLQAVLEEDAGNYRAWYEMAFLYYMQKDYTTAVRIIEKLKTSPGVQDGAYQLLGNAYDYLGERDKAVAAYREGLERFPRSGKLYLEMGNIASSERKYPDALALYEQGVAAQPAFPSNYYHLANLFFNSSEPVWGVFYGELFLNLERGSRRTRQISRELYNAYIRAITIEPGDEPGEKTLSVIFGRNDEIYMTADSLLQVPFGTAIYEPLAGKSFPPEADSVDLASLNRMRCDFVDNYYALMDDLRGKVAFIPDTPNVLLDYQRRIARAGHMEAYNYWLLKEGDPEQAAAWCEGHRSEWDVFMAWFRENPLELDAQHYFHRSLFDQTE